MYLGCDCISGYFYKFVLVDIVKFFIDKGNFCLFIVGMFYGVKFNVDGIGEWIVLIFDIVVNFVCFSDIVVDSFIIGIVYLFYLDWN